LPARALGFWLKRGIFQNGVTMTAVSVLSFQSLMLLSHP